MKIKRLSSMILVMALLATVVGVVLAAERLTNGTFESDVNGWNTSSGTIAHETTITHNSSAGSARVTNTYSGSSAYSGGAVQCTDIPSSGSGDYYTAKGWVYIPSDVAANFEYAYIRVRYYELDNCSTSIGSNIDSNHVTTTGSWQEITNIAAVPASAESAQVRLFVRKSDGSANPYVYFDDITFYDSNANAVTLSSFVATSARPAGLPWLAVAGVALVGVAAVVWRRRLI